MFPALSPLSARMSFETGSVNRFHKSVAATIRCHGAQASGRDTMPHQPRTCSRMGGIRRWAVDDQAIRAALERHWSDINDQDVVHEIYHDDVVLEFPQGGERLVGLTNVARCGRSIPPP